MILPSKAMYSLFYDFLCLFAEETKQLKPCSAGIRFMMRAVKWRTGMS